MTERIFYTDVCCHTFQAAVLDCQPRKKKGYEVILDKTAFYPVKAILCSRSHGSF